MNIYPSFTNIRSYTAYKFASVRMHALREYLWSRLLGRNTKLALFPEDAPQKSPNRAFAGVQEIPVEQIVGTLGRQSDFDYKFRPLKKYLRDRWVNAYLTLESEGWSPILVHKVGDGFYVEDGHHRVSVARSLGLHYIQAKVWEYPVQQKQTPKCPSLPCRERSTARAYVAQ